MAVTGTVNGMASEHYATSWTWLHKEPEPTAEERQLYELFCHEYLYDHNIAAAASRCGFQASVAEEYGKLIFSRSYVQRRLRELKLVGPATLAEAKMERDYDNRFVKATLREILGNPFAKKSDRIAAGRQLAAMHGLNAPLRVETSTARTGVIAVPEIADLEEWERTAAASQQALADASRVE